MKSAPPTPDEAQRLEALRATGLLDSLPEQDFDDLTRVAAAVCQVPMALISLIDQDRQWFKSRVGLEAQQTARDVAFCAHAIHDVKLFEVPDSLQDERFHDNPLVTGPPLVRFYAGMPLRTPEGYALGTLCVLDQQPRQLNEQQRQALAGLARQVMRQLELRQLARDLADRNQALLQTQRQFQDLLDNTTDLIQVSDPEGYMLFVNQAWQRTLGYTVEEMQGRLAREVLQVDPGPLRAQVVPRVLAGEVVPIDLTLRAKDGRQVQVEGNLSARFRDGKLASFRGIYRDVTAERQARATLREQAQLLEVAREAIVARQLDGQVIYWNRGAEELYGFSRAEVQAQPVHTLLETHFPERLQTVEAALVAAGHWEGELTQRRRDGTSMVVEARWVLQHKGPGEPPVVLEINSEITGRRRAEEAVRSLAARQQAVLDSAPYAILFTGEGGEVKTFSAGAERMLGYSFAEVVGQLPPTAFLDPGELEKRAAQLSLELGRPVAPGPEVLTAWASLGRTDRWETLGLRRDGTRFPLSLSVTEVRDQVGRQLGHVAIGEDITERQAVERLKGEFVSVVSHELRTPLTSIRGALGLLEGGVVGEVPEPAQELVRIARDNSDRLIRLVNDILDLEKIESGKMELNPVRLGTRDLWQKALESVQGMAAAAGVTLELEAAEGTLQGDQDRLVQVLVNLVSNAVKFSPSGGKVRVAARRQGPQLRFTIRDQGPGIPADKVGKLFQKFSQLDSSDTRQKGGTGLGLAITKAIVEQHGGRVGVTSGPGQGSVFWVELPAERGMTPFASVIPVGPGPAPLVLVVEPDLPLANRLEEQLTAERYRVKRVETLAQALESLERDRPAALVLDMDLPDGSGAELFARLRGPEGLTRLPVLVVSARTADQVWLGGPVLVDWLTKPLNEERLLSALKRAVRSPGQPRVLLVDDDPGFRQVAAAQLERLGVSCIQAADGEEALAQALHGEPDLIILDVSLPAADGFEVVETLRRAGKRPPPLLVYSGRDLTAVDRRALSLRTTRFLTKSLTTETEFLSAVRELLNGLLKGQAGFTPVPPAPRG